MLNSPCVIIKSFREKFVINTRKKMIIYVSLASVYIIAVFIMGITINPQKYAVNYEDKFVSPCASHIFGTDFMGRDMFYRCIKGLSNSILIGVIAAGISSFIAFIFGISSAVIGGIYDKIINWCVDACMGIPHLILLILISFMMGRGGIGVTVAVALTHWPALTRIVRAEVLQVRSAQYVKASYKMGKSRFEVAKTHIIPHVIPVYLVGVILLFPHAIMHEASITFLGFGLSQDVPAIGVVLSEAMKHIDTGKWYLAVFPGLMLLSVVMLFDVIGENLKKLNNPVTSHE